MLRVLRPPARISIHIPLVSRHIHHGEYRAESLPPLKQFTFYDIPSILPQCAWSPNTWKTRFTLNYKNIPYKTEWVEYPDIQARCKELGIAPTGKKANGEDSYTLPVIHDPQTGKYVSDSFAIAQYLEETYLDRPTVFPRGTGGLQSAFTYAHRAQMQSMFPFIYAPECSILKPRSRQYFRQTREATFGCTLEDLVPKGKEGETQWRKFRQGLGRVNAWYSQSRGRFIAGNDPSWADFVVASYVIWWRSVWGVNSKEWEDISTWHDGRWNALLEDLKHLQEVS